MRFGTESILYAFIKIYIQKNMLINRIWLISCRVERVNLIQIGRRMWFIYTALMMN